MKFLEHSVRDKPIVSFRAGEPANFLAAPAPHFFSQAAPAPGIFFRAAPAPRGQNTRPAPAPQPWQ